MTLILIPIDGSRPSLKALEAALELNPPESQAELFLLAVMPPLIGRARGLLTFEQLNAFYLAEADLMLQQARTLLQSRGVTYQERVVVGNPAEMIAKVARQINAAQIYMGTRGRGATASLLLGSVAAKVITLSDLPITLVNQEENPNA